MLALASVTATAASVSVADEPNPPVWPSTVRIFSPGDSDIQTTVDAAFTDNGGHDPDFHGQFSSSRYAFMFKPGTYTQDVPVGYYTTVHGLGSSPDDVIFSGAKGVYSEEGSYTPSSGALSNFWRGAENFKSQASYAWPTGTGMLWAVSQASPLRRIHVTNDLALYSYHGPYSNAGMASGGFAADMKVDGTVRPGSQQQFCTTTSTLGGWDGGLWNMFFYGVSGAPAEHCGWVPSTSTNTSAFMRGAPTITKRHHQKGNVVESKQEATKIDAPQVRVGGSQASIVKVDTAPLAVPKPYVRVASSDTTKFELVVPAKRTNAVGHDWDSTGATVVDFSNVYVASASSDTSTTINAKLAAGKHVVMSPGIYQLDAPLLLNTDGQVLLGLGLATLVAANGTPTVQVGNVKGVRVAGLLLQAGALPTTTLLQWGDGTSAGDADSPGAIHDVYARIGGPDTTAVQADKMLVIASGHVYGDNLWLWRADHGVGGLVKNGANPCETGIEVSGADVTFVGLAVEHTLGDLVYWSGERGTTYFYQSELPYDVNASYGTAGFAGYRVADTVTDHDAYATGVYHYFRDFAVTVTSGIVVPAALANRIRSALSVYLNGLGTITHVLNANGGSTAPADGSGATAYWCPTSQ